MKHLLFTLLTGLVLTGCGKSHSPQQLPAEQESATSDQSSNAEHSPAVNKALIVQQEPEDEFAELTRYEGDWIINGDRHSMRVVSNREGSAVQTFTTEFHENFGCPFTRFTTMRMTFDPKTGVYRARIKWSGGKVEEHLRTPWLPHDLVGEWNSETETMTWANEKFVNHMFGKLEITTKFQDENNQTFQVFEVDGERRLQQLADANFDRLH